MHTLSYTISPVLQQRLKEIELNRQRILLQPLALSAELQYRWQASTQRIYYSLHLSHNPVTLKEIERILKSPGKFGMPVAEKDVVNYKKGLDYINREWLVNSKPIMPQALQFLYRTVTADKTKLPESEIMEMLVFLQTSREHPLVQAFISFVQLGSVLPINDISGKLARLLPYLFLYKSGLDFRGLLVLEEYFYRNERLIRDLQAAVENKDSVTVWVEHFIQSIASQTDDTAKNIAQQGSVDIGQKIWQLTERQKEMLTTFDQPGMRITNRKVQQLFKISQITASRDLAKLATLGLLFQYGKGRSVYYMRA